MSRVVSVIVFCAALAACGGGKTQKNTVADFQMPDVPSMIVVPTERADYLVAHYWNRYNFADTSIMRSKRFREEIWPNYIGFLNLAMPDKAARSVKSLLARLESDTASYNHFSGQLAHYLGDPNSPMRNEDIYIAVLEQMVASPAVDEYEKIRLEDRLTLTKRNRPGMIANDFVYTRASGASARMHDLKADWTILFFNNPGCPACRDIMNDLISSDVVMSLIASGELKVLALYPDEDLTEWYKYGDSFPRTWIYARDASQSIRDGELYDLKAIPTLYLLDKDKRVVVKDALDVRQILHYLPDRG